MSPSELPAPTSARADIPVRAVPITVLDRTDVRRARQAPGILRAFNDAAVLSAADVHVARRLTDLTELTDRSGELGAAGATAGAGSETDADADAVRLGVALAVRAPRLGHVCVDLTAARHEVTADTDLPVDLDALPWPDPARWLAALSSHPLVTVGEAGDGHGEASDRPLRLVGPRLYLDRYWRQERRVVAEVLARGAEPAEGVDDAVLEEGLARLFGGPAPAHEPEPAVADRSPALAEGPTSTGNADAGVTALSLFDDAAGAAGARMPSLFDDPSLGAASATAGGAPDDAGDDGTEPDRQRLAAAMAVRRRFAVVAGGPGTGKTTTVARILALLDEQARAAGTTPPRVALAAPTGKAAARLQEAVHHEAGRLAVDEATRQRLLGSGAATLHRLLGWRPDSHSRFRHHRGNRLPHDVVVVDEASMVSLSLMAKLLEAVRPDARLILVGDPDQLASVEAGAVLGDIVGPDPHPAESGARSGPVGAGSRPGSQPGGVGEGIVVLRRVHRFGGDIARLADAIQRGDAAGAAAVLGSAGEDVSWIPVDLADRSSRGRLEPVRRRIVDAGRSVLAAAHAGDGRAALDALSAVRVLCAHRHGPYGVAEWMPVIERWLVDALPGYGAGGRWYIGRPLLVTENDYGLQLYNGDAGVIIETPEGGARAAFERRGEPVLLSPTRLGAVETVHAMTVHKSQGSQFGSVTVLLPDEASPLLSRELLYTAVTRAQHHLTVVGTEAAVRAAIGRPIARASGLQAALWPDPR